MDPELKEGIAEWRKDNIVTGSLADSIITNLIDNCYDEQAAADFGMSEEEWNKLVQEFEEQIRHRVRNLK